MLHLSAKIPSKIIYTVQRQKLNNFRFNSRIKLKLFRLVSRKSFRLFDSVNVRVNLKTEAEILILAEEIQNSLTSYLSITTRIVIGQFSGPYPTLRPAKI